MSNKSNDYLITQSAKMRKKRVRRTKIKWFFIFTANGKRITFCRLLCRLLRHLSHCYKSNNKQAGCRARIVHTWEMENFKFFNFHPPTLSRRALRMMKNVCSLIQWRIHLANCVCLQLRQARKRQIPVQIPPCCSPHFSFSQVFFTLRWQRRRRATTRTTTTPWNTANNFTFK